MTYKFITGLVCLTLQNIITCQIKLQFKYPEISIFVSTWLCAVKFANFAVLLTCWQSAGFVFPLVKRILSAHQKDSIQSLEAVDLKSNYAPFRL